MAHLGLPVWLQYLLEGIFIFIGIACSAVTLTRAGKSPYFAFLLMIPFVNIAAVWWFAWQPWNDKALKKEDNSVSP